MIDQSVPNHAGARDSALLRERKTGPYLHQASGYHLVTRMNPGVNDGWDADEVFRRCSMLYSVPDWVLDVRIGNAAVEEVAAHDFWIRRRRG